MGAKLRIFKTLDAPESPGGRGLRKFLSEITDEEFDVHRQKIKDTTVEQIKAVADKYLGAQSKSRRAVSVLGPETSASQVDGESNWTTEPLA